MARRRSRRTPRRRSRARRAFRTDSACSSPTSAFASIIHSWGGSRPGTSRRSRSCSAPRPRRWFAEPWTDSSIRAGRASLSLNLDEFSLAVSVRTGIYVFEAEDVFRWLRYFRDENFFGESTKEPSHPDAVRDLRKAPREAAAMRRGGARGPRSARAQAHLPVCRWGCHPTTSTCSVAPARSAKTRRALILHVVRGPGPRRPRGRRAAARPVRQRGGGCSGGSRAREPRSASRVARTASARPSCSCSRAKGPDARGGTASAGGTNGSSSGAPARSSSCRRRSSSLTSPSPRSAPTRT